MLSRRLQMLFVVLMFMVAACGKTDPNQIQVIDNAFSPRTTTIEVGSSVNWSWNGQAPHNVVFEVGSNLPSSQILNAPASYQVTFTTPGTFNYECTLHGGMTGTIIVK